MRNTVSYRPRTPVDLDMPFPVEKVGKAYNGQVGCMCGCLGDYAHLPEFQEAEGRKRGYSVDDDEVSPRKVRTRYNAVVKAMKSGDFDVLTVDDEIVYMERNGRAFCLYNSAGRY